MRMQMNLQGVRGPGHAVQLWHEGCWDFQAHVQIP